MSTVSFVDPEDEFALVAEIASERGLTGPLPSGRRFSTPTEAGRVASGIEWGSSPAVTFLHGAGLNAHTWDTTVLSLGIDALAIDLPGHGDSSWRDDADYRARTLAPDIATVIRSRTDRPQVVVGQSLGGLTAAAVASLDPALVRALVIVDITPGIDPSAGPAQIRAFFSGPTDWATRDELVDRALEFGFGGGTRRRAERGVYFNSRIRPDGRVEWKHHFAHLAAQAASLAPTDRTDTSLTDPAPRQILSAAGWEDLADATAPITLVRGDRGYVTPADAEEFATRVPTATILTLSAGHNVQEDDPVRLAEVIRQIAR